VLPLRAVAAGLAAQATVLAALAPGLRGWLVGLAVAAAVCGALAVGLARTGAVALGAANGVTLARAALVGGVTALVVEDRPALLVAAVAAVALAMDFVDGQVARRTGTATRVGARFDMELDAFLLLVLSVQVALSLGWWVVAIGAWRYLFLGAGRLVAWLRRPLPDSFLRKTVAATQGVVLVVVASEVLPRLANLVLTALSLTVLTLSFLRDVGWQHRNRRV